MAATAATTPGSLDSDAPSFSDDPAAMSQSSLTSATSDEDDESLMSTPKRYPAHLSHGSAPRRRQWANSSQYESMEELLTAAGYTVTRVFTPETERVQKLAEHQEEGEARKTADEGARSPSGIGRLVTGLIAHILPAGGSTATRRETPQVRVELVDDSESNPFLESGSPTRTASACAYPQAAQSLRTHLLSTHAVSRPNSGSRPRQPLHPNHRAQPALRHTNSAPSLPRITSARRRALPSAWRDAAPSTTKPMWSGGFVPKTVETQLKPCAGPSWFGSVRSSAGHEPRPQTSPAATIRPRNLLKPPSLHRARSAPRSTCVHVPLPAPSARPSPVVQQNTVVCRSQSSLAIPPRARSESRGRHHAEESPILAPEPGSTAAEGLPPTPARPALHRARSNGFLRRPAAVHAPHPSVADDEPDLASIVSAFRSSSPSRRQRSIRSLRALLKDPRFPDVPVVCVASPGTVGTGGPGRAVWMTGPGWEAEVRRKNVLGARG